MKRIWLNYEKWEDYKHGLFRTEKIESEEVARDLVFNLFSNQELFYKSGIEMMQEWPNSTDFNLSNTTQNRKSYLGQAVSCFLYGIPMKYTAKYFTEIDEKDQGESNKTAEMLIRFYENHIYNENHPNIIRGKNEKLS